ncbi:hypothetical protein ACFVZJ_11090 [Streptomyces sp. NPDC058322]|uniref:hypothetical protein n=1 Tax=Streptomyces sp. NPDC058322 TaxID=3346446 RepID=UPI0036E8E0BF
MLGRIGVNRPFSELRMPFLAWIDAEAGDLSEVWIVEVEARILQEQDAISRVDDGTKNQCCDASPVRVGDQFS